MIGTEIVRGCLRGAGRVGTRNATGRVTVSSLAVSYNQCLHSQVVQKDCGDQGGRQALGSYLYSCTGGALRDGCGRFLYAQDGVPLVTSATIRGQKRIELQAIEGRFTLKPNDRYTADALREQVKILYGTGYFEDVQVETDPGPGGVAVVFVVREKPFITEIVFDGNEELSDDKLKEKITIKSQTFLDQQQAKESAEKIRLAYQEDGYYSCQVIPVIQSVDEDRKRLTYFIKEGHKAKVRHINFEGMRAVTQRGNVQGDGDPGMDSVVWTHHAVEGAVVALGCRRAQTRGTRATISSGCGRSIRIRAI